MQLVKDDDCGIPSWVACLQQHVINKLRAQTLFIGCQMIRRLLVPWFLVVFIVTIEASALLHDGSISTTVNDSRKKPPQCQETLYRPIATPVCREESVDFINTSTHDTKNGDSSSLVCSPRMRWLWTGHHVINKIHIWR